MEDQATNVVPLGGQSKCTLRRVRAELLEFDWETVQSQIRTGAMRSGGRISEQSIRDGCRKGAMVLWIVVDERGNHRGVVVTERITYATGLKTLCLLLVAGIGIKDWFHLVGDLEKMAREWGCSKIEGWGREGWERVSGWKRVQVLLEKELSDVKSAERIDD